MNPQRTGLDVIIVLVTLSICAVGGLAGIFYLISNGVGAAEISIANTLVSFAIGAIAGVLARTTRPPTNADGSMPVTVVNPASEPVPTTNESEANHGDES